MPHRPKSKVEEVPDRFPPPPGGFRIVIDRCERMHIQINGIEVGVEIPLRGNGNFMPESPCSALSADPCVLLIGRLLSQWEAKAFRADCFEWCCTVRDRQDERRRRNVPDAKWRVPSARGLGSSHNDRGHGARSALRRQESRATKAPPRGWEQEFRTFGRSFFRKFEMAWLQEQLQVRVGVIAHVEWRCLFSN